MEMKEAGNRLRIARKNLGWTQAMLAEKVDISTSFVGHLERGTRFASIETWVALCDKLNISIDSVLGRRGDYSQTNPSDDYFILQHALKAKEIIGQLCSLLEKPSVP